MTPEPRLDKRRGLSARFWGTRGSLPRPGRDYLQYGGNTSCVEVRLGDRLFLLDAGSGLEPAGRALGDLAPRQVDILLSHLHHDHIAGLPFFPPALDDSVTLRTFCGNLEGASAEQAFARMFSPPLFPITLDRLPCRWDHRGFRGGDTLKFDDGIEVRTCPLVHPGGATAYRFDYEGSSLCYVSDLEHVPGEPNLALLELCAGADLVIYDTMFTDSEFRACKGWGHSTLGAGVLLCRTAGAKVLAATHHHIAHTDAILERLDAELRQVMPGSFLAREGQAIHLGGTVVRGARRPTLEIVV